MAKAGVAESDRYHPPGANHMGVLRIIICLYPVPAFRQCSSQP